MDMRKLTAALLLSLVTFLAVARDVTVPSPPGDGLDEIRTLINRKIDFYNREFPQIRFVHLEGGADWHGDMMALMMLLGADADNLDYAHPPSLQADLLAVSLERLRQLLQRDIISATTFRVGRKSKLDRPYMCAITLNPRTVLRDDREATRHMLDFSDEAMARVHPSRYLNPMDHLEFAIDHEAHHCLQAYHYGGLPQANDPMHGEYHAFRSESMADAYAMAMHIRARGSITPYARNLVHLRALWMFTDTPNRCTFETVRELLRYEPSFLSSLTTPALMELASHITDRTIGSFDAYLQQRVAALKAATRLGFDPRLYGVHWRELATRPANPALVEFLVHRYRFYDAELSSDRPIPLDAQLK